MKNKFTVTYYEVHTGEMRQKTFEADNMYDAVDKGHFHETTMEVLVNVQRLEDNSLKINKFPGSFVIQPFDLEEKNHFIFIASPIKAKVEKRKMLFKKINDAVIESGKSNNEIAKSLGMKEEEFELLLAGNYGLTFDMLYMFENMFNITLLNV